MTAEFAHGVDLYWLPLGAGGHSVRLNGLVFEAVVARLERRLRCDLYHSALVVRSPSGHYVIEQAPVRDNDGAKRGVVAEGAVGSRLAGRFRIFRYEVRRWRDGVIPDIGLYVAEWGLRVRIRGGEGLVAGQSQPPACRRIRSR